MKQILNMLRMDKLLILREKIAVYVILVPIVMSGIIMAALSAVENDNIRLAVTADVPQPIMERLENYVDVEVAGNQRGLIKRMNEFDSMAGVYLDGDALQVLFQGNEGPEYEAAIRNIVVAAMEISLPAFTARNVATGRDALTQMIIAVLLTAPAAIGGIVSGFNIVAEKETLMSRAYRISPLPTGGYLMSRYIVSILAGLVNLISISLILGMGGKLPWVLMASVFALPLFASSPLLIGGIAKDKMGCISMIKVIMLIFVCLPIAAGMTPEKWQFFYWPLPMYWHFKTIESILRDNFNLIYGVLTLVISGAVFAVLAATLGKKLQKI